MRIGEVAVGDGAPLALIAGLNVIESEAATICAARILAEKARAHGFPLVFKASFDKANRSSAHSYRGPGLEEGLRILRQVKRETGLPILTDVHEPLHAKAAAEVADCVQIPAFLCRQTDLLKACAASGLPVNVKKGQFMAPEDMRHVVEKLTLFGAAGVLLTERGTSFGYNGLVADLRALPILRAFAPVCFDASHAVQIPGGGDGSSSGERRFVAPLARAAVAVGIDALFVECHPEPDQAPCDADCQIPFDDLDPLLMEVSAVDAALRAVRGAR